MGIIAGQAARELGVSTATLAAWAEQGKIRAQRATCGWRFYDPEDVQRLKRELEQKRAAKRRG